MEEIIKIHPYDLMDLVIGTDLTTVVHFAQENGSIIIIIDGKKYLQSVDVPCKTKNIV